MGGNLGHFGLQTPGTGSGGTGPQGFQGSVGVQGFQGGGGAGSYLSALAQLVDVTVALGVTPRYGMGSNAPQATVAGASQAVIPVAGNIDDLTAFVVANTADAATVITLFVNGVASALTLTVGVGVTGVVSATGAVAVAAGDRVTIEFKTTATTGSCISKASVSYKT